MNFSTWDSLATKPKLRSSFIPGEVIVEFDRTKSEKIVSHILGNIEFTNVLDINPQRQTVINREIDNLSENGFRYNKISHVYTENVITTPNENEEYVIYSHGSPLGGEFLGKESCLQVSLKCEEGEGEDRNCNPGKCLIGYVKKVKDTKWVYESFSKFGEEEREVVYYFPSEKSVQLKTILRGRYGELPITSHASVASTLYLPPKYYFSENFIDRVFERVDKRLESVTDKPSSIFIGIDDRKTLFIQKIVVLASSHPTGGFINQELYSTDHSKVIEVLLDLFSELDGVWFDVVKQIIVEESNAQESNFDLIGAVYEQVFELFDKLIQVIPSSVKKSTYENNKETVARPVYSRLPGLAEAYRSDPAFSDEETPAQWLVSGVDELLATKKEEVALFYRNYLDPDTCSPFVLDWLAQHLGLTGELWDIDWEKDVKICMIKNIFGWWDRESSISLPSNGEVREIYTPKGVVLEQFPFTQEPWVNSDSDDNSLDVLYSEIKTVKASCGCEGIIGDGSYYKRIYNEETNLVSLEPVNQIEFFKGLWNGLIEAKGGMLAVVFLCSLFKLKSHTALELEIVEEEGNSPTTIRPKSGLRSAELNAPVLMPVKYDVVQVGTEKDAKINNYSNQLIAGVTRFSSVEESKNVFFRVPYYYNRNGRSWNKIEYIKKAWMPSNLNVRIQYPYLSADLWAVGDAFFELELEEEEDGEQQG